MAKPTRTRPPVPTPLPARTEPPPPPPLTPVRWRTVSLAEWRKSKERVEWTTGLLRDPQFLEFLAMLRWQVQQRDNVPVDQLSINIEFGRGEGRRDVLDWIEQAAQPLLTPIPPALAQPNYGVQAGEESTEDLTGGGYDLPTPQP